MTTAAFRSDIVNHIHCGDSMRLIADLPDECVDCVVTDPPYGINYHSNHYKESNPHSAIANDDQLLLPLKEISRVLKPTGALFFFFSYKNPPKCKMKNKIIWVKNNWSAGDLDGDYGNQYEEIAFIPKRNFKIIGKRLPNVWFADREPPVYHPTQKPIKLLRYAIQSACPKGGVVLDPFMGGGSTAMAAIHEGCNYIGMEIEEKYCDIARKRIAAVKNQGDLFKSWQAG